MKLLTRHVRERESAHQRLKMKRDNKKYRAERRNKTFSLGLKSKFLFLGDRDNLWRRDGCWHCRPQILLIILRGKITTLAQYRNGDFCPF